MTHLRSRFADRTLCAAPPGGFEPPTCGFDTVAQSVLSFGGHGTRGLCRVLASRYRHKHTQKNLVDNGDSLTISSASASICSEVSS